MEGTALKKASVKRKVVVGEVISNKMQKTIVVRVNHKVRHPLYKKYIIRSVRYKAHDEENIAQIGDQVSLVASRPLSKEKRWALVEVLRKALTGIAAGSQTRHH